MRITPQRHETADITASSKTAQAPVAPVVRSPAQLAANPATAALASSVISEAARRLGEQPEVDLARVAEIRAAMARGDITLDAAKLADIIADYHRS